MAGEMPTHLDPTQIQAITSRLAHMPLLDLPIELTDVDYGKQGHGLMTYTPDKWPPLAAHFPAFPVTPAAFLVDSLLQLGAIVILGHPDNLAKTAEVELDRWRFPKPVFHGQVISLTVDVNTLEDNIFNCHGVATFEGGRLVEGTSKFLLL